MSGQMPGNCSYPGMAGQGVSRDAGGAKDGVSRLASKAGTLPSQDPCDP